MGPSARREQLVHDPSWSAWVYILTKCRPPHPSTPQSTVHADAPQNASSILGLINSQSHFLLDASDSRPQIFTNQSYPYENGYDLASWTISTPSTASSSGTTNGNTTQTLVFAVNTNYGPNDSQPGYRAVFALAEYAGKVKEVLMGDVSEGPDGGPVFSMPRTSVTAVVLEM
jgi:hypothetical protein